MNPLVAIRKNNNLTTREFAKIIGVTCGTITQYEKDNVKPRIKHLLKYRKLDPTFDFNKLLDYYKSVEKGNKQ
ncbi:MAG: helix-turn-helix transcriptional regulator [Culicoidibacterales bacterium]